jgi:outer membrane lipoprotein-sorting protein
MIDYLPVKTEYLKRMAAVVAMLVCLGCAGNKSVGEVNMPPKDVDAAPKTTAPKTPAASEANEIDTLLSQLDKKCRELETYQAKISYTLKQPVLESEALREGMLYYMNHGKKSMLRINFMNLWQDKDAVPNYREEYLFDGVNLTRIEYKTKNVEYRQLADANEPINAFELASRYLPIVGFTNPASLRDDFEIKHNAADDYDELLLTPKSQSHYKNDYKIIQFYTSKRLSLPARIETTSPDGDSTIIRLSDVKVNKELPKDIFTIAVPADFSKNIVPFEKGKN